MKRIIFILFALVILMPSCNDTMLEHKYEQENEQIIMQDTPFSWKNDIPALRASASTQKEMASLDMERIFREDMEDERFGIPPRFGYRHSVNYNLENSGEWITLPDGSKLWRLTISSPGALSINLLYDKFWIPDGAKFWIYSTDRRQLLNTMTSANNSGTRDDIQGFATGLVFSDQITLEYFLPSSATEIGFISIAYVVHGYRHIRSSGVSTRINFGGSQRCHININCPEGQPWRNERNAVALILIDGFRLCTGFLINTTANDRRPLFMTANHCLPMGIDAVNSPSLPHWTFIWHFESPMCADTFPTRWTTTTGGRLIANNPISDFALLNLTGTNSDPRNRADITTYFLGWDRSGNPGVDEWVGIHHPAGDIKKISFANQIQNVPSQTIWGSGAISPPNTLWHVSWYRGLVEGGSSGSPLINRNRKVIGQLFGSPAGQTCETTNPVSRYGRFDVSWTGTTTGIPHPDRERRLGHWLAPGRENNAPLTMCSSPPVIHSITHVNSVGAPVHTPIHRGPVFFAVNHNCPDVATSVTWSIFPSLGVVMSPWCRNSVQVGFAALGHYTITASVTNACGTTTFSQNITVVDPWPPVNPPPVVTCPYCLTPSNMPPGCPRCLLSAPPQLMSCPLEEQTK